MSDDQLRRWLEAADQPRRPDPSFTASLLSELREELGFAATDVRPVTGFGVRLTPRRAGGRPGPFRMLLIAAIVVIASGGLVIAAGAIRERLVPPPPVSLLAQIRQTGHLRIAIRPDHPQFTIGGQTAIGFDADVAIEIARRLGVTSDLVIEGPAMMAGQRRGEVWDIALPSVPTWTVDTNAFLTSAPYYGWPHMLVVPTTSAATSLQDVAPGPICAVADDAGLAWLQGDYGGTASTPITSTVVTRASDADCLAALASAEALAAVTARLSAADLQTRGDVRAIGGPAPEPRAVIVGRYQGSAADPVELLHAIDQALIAMHSDGTLTRLSENRFGGADLSTP